MTDTSRAPLSSCRHGVLGRTGLAVCRLGISASYGVPAAAVERAFEAGVNYLYFGSMRKSEFCRAIRNLRRHRERMVLVIQSYSRFASVLEWSLSRALRQAGMDYADVLLLGGWNSPVWPRVMERARKLVDRGLVRHLAQSTHNRPLVPRLAAAGGPDIFHIRYNAVHTGAERDIFPHLGGDGRPGIVAFTATCWGQLLRARRLPPGERRPTATDCYRFVLSNPNVDLCMTGPASAEHVEQSLEALRLGPLSAEETAWMRRVGEALYGKKRGG